MNRLFALGLLTSLSLGSLNVLAGTECTLDAHSVKTGKLLDTAMVLSSALDRAKNETHALSITSRYELPNSAKEVVETQSMNGSDSYEIILSASFDASGKPRFQVSDFQTPYQGSISEHLILDTMDWMFSAGSHEIEYRGVRFSIRCRIATGA